MANKLMRAFTITELVIVLAVVAILAAVLIPTFSNIVQRSRGSADTQNVRSMNETLNDSSGHRRASHGQKSKQGAADVSSLESTTY